MSTDEVLGISVHPLIQAAGRDDEPATPNAVARVIFVKGMAVRTDAALDKGFARLSIDNLADQTARRRRPPNRDENRALEHKDCPVDFLMGTSKRLPMGARFAQINIVGQTGSNNHQAPKIDRVGVVEHSPDHTVGHYQRTRKLLGKTPIPKDQALAAVIGLPFRIGVQILASIQSIQNEHSEQCQCLAVDIVGGICGWVGRPRLAI